MKLVDEWRWVVRRAWSFKLGLLAAFFGALEVLVNIYIYVYEPPVWLPRGWFVGFAVGVTLLASVLRLFQQERD